MSLDQKVIGIVSDASKVDIAKISLATSLVDDLNLDSLSLVELMMKIEDEFKIEVPESDAEGLKTVTDIVKYIENKQ